MPKEPLTSSPTTINTIKPCRHSYSFLRSVQERLRGPYISTWIRTDEFYCSKCLTIRELATRTQSEHAPAWWNA